jgi:hypothetical protein
MLPILIPIISAIVPLLVRKAEDEFKAPKTGAEKHAWVQGAVHDVVDILQAKLGDPSWLDKIEVPLEKIVSDAIEAALDAMEAQSIK